MIQTGNCLHGSRAHCWHKLAKDYPKIVIWECCRCQKHKRTYKPGYKPTSQTH